MAKADIQEQYGLFINGEFVPASDGATFDAHNPANGEHLAYFAEATKEDVDSAVKAARAALPAWSKTSPIERQNILLKIADIIDANADHLALVETLDNGKPIRETKAADIPLGSDHFRYFAGCLRAWEGSATMLDDNTLSLILHEPVGVVGQVIPWNFPFLMGAWKLAPVLAALGTILVVFILVGTMLWAFLSAGGADTIAVGVMVLYGVVGLAVVGGVLAALIQRLREIKRGEEEDAKEY